MRVSSPPSSHILPHPYSRLLACDWLCVANWSHAVMAHTVNGWHLTRANATAACSVGNKASCFECSTDGNTLKSSQNTCITPASLESAGLHLVICILAWIDAAMSTLHTRTWLGEPTPSMLHKFSPYGLLKWAKPCYKNKTFSINQRLCSHLHHTARKFVTHFNSGCQWGVPEQTHFWF